MVFGLDLITNLFHGFAEHLYGSNMQEQENWKPGKWFLSSFNFGGLANSDSFQVEWSALIGRDPSKYCSLIS